MVGFFDMPLIIIKAAMDTNATARMMIGNNNFLVFINNFLLYIFVCLLIYTQKTTFYYKRSTIFYCLRAKYDKRKDSGTCTEALPFFFIK